MTAGAFSDTLQVYVDVDEIVHRPRLVHRNENRMKRRKVLIADEPTTALDVTIQAQILELMRRLRREYNTAIIFITHDLGVVAENADNIIVMGALSSAAARPSGHFARLQRPQPGSD